MTTAHKTILAIPNIFLVIWFAIVRFADLPGYGIMDNILLITSVAVIIISSLNAIAIHLVLSRKLFVFSQLQTVILIILLISTCLFGGSNAGYHDMGKIFYIPFGIFLLIICSGLNILIFRVYKR